MISALFGGRQFPKYHIMFRIIASSTAKRFVRFNSTIPTAAYTEIIQTVRQDLKTNIRKKADPLEKNVIRSILTEVKNMEIANQDKPKDEFLLYDLLVKMIKERNSSAATYMKEGSPDNFKQIGLNELREASFLQAYLEKLPVAAPAEIDAKVTEIYNSLNKDGLVVKESDLFKRIPWGTINTEWKASKLATTASVKRVFEKNNA